MGLRLLRSADDLLVGPAARRELALALGRGRRAVVLVPTMGAALAARRELATEPGLALGVACTTPSAWVAEQWRRLGPGSEPVDASRRAVLVRRSLDSADAAGGLDHGEGTLRMLSALVRDALPWVAGDPLHADELSGPERAVLAVARDYASRLAAHGLVEPCDAMAGLPRVLGDAGALPGTVLLAGFDDIGRPLMELVCGMAVACELVVVLADGNRAALAALDDLAERLRRRASELGASVEDLPKEAPGASPRAPALDGLVRSLFGPSDPPCPADGVSLLEAAGPSAEAELVAREASALAARGARRVVVCAPDAIGAWRDLAPKLVCRGLSVRGELSAPVEGVGAAAFLSMARSVARLVGLAAQWPADAAQGPVGDMSWWPPRELTDFLLSDCAGVERSRAWALDAEWRGNRMLSPAMVLAALERPKRTSETCAGAVRELVRGRVGTAAERLRAALELAEVPSDPARALARSLDLAGLAAVRDAAASLRGIGVGVGAKASPEQAAERLPGIVEALVVALRDQRVALRPRLAAAQGACEVLIAAPSSVRMLPAASVDALVCVGLDTVRWAIPARDDALSLLLSKLGVEPAADAVSRARADFHRLVRVPVRELVLERSLADASSAETYPAVMLTETLAALGVDAASAKARAALVGGSLGEWEVSANVADDGVAPAALCGERRGLLGSVGERVRGLVLVPRDGQGADARRELSASQIESYLECPYKWFALRRLGLDCCDAGFSNLEMGSFAHRVLEVCHRELLDGPARELARQRGWNESSGVGYAEFFDPALEPRIRLEGSRVTPENLRAAHALLDAEFDLHARHQRELCVRRPSQARRAQALVAHTPSEEIEMRRLRQDLHGVLDFEQGAFEGFEPRMFEQRFGGRSGTQVEYAGIGIQGTIDRVDADASGNLLVIDYKHKANLFSEYALFGTDDADEFRLPRRVQTLVYATALMRAASAGGRVEPRVVGAVYLGTRGDAKAVSGAMDEQVADRVLPAGTSGRSRERVCVPGGGVSSMRELLERTEELVGRAVGRMLAGDIEARPRDARACEWCPVADCARRIS